MNCLCPESLDTNAFHSTESLFLMLKISNSPFSDLFDYSSDNSKDTNLRINSSGILVNKKDTLKFISLNNLSEYTDENDLILLKYEKKIAQIYLSPKNSYFIDGSKEYEDMIKTESLNSILESTDLMWRVVPNENNKKVNEKYIELKRNDIVKLGKYKIFVSEISTHNKLNNYYSEGKKNSHETFSLFDKINLKTGKTEAKENEICRVCYGDNHDEKNPLISICNCSGSVKFIHVNCLEKWIYTKMKVTTNKNLTTIKCKKFYCEICFVDLPSNIINLLLF